jgi:tRNA-dihydrouridine synthase 3
MMSMSSPPSRCLAKTAFAASRRVPAAAADGFSSSFSKSRRHHHHHHHHHHHNHHRGKTNNNTVILMMKANGGSSSSFFFSSNAKPAATTTTTVGEDDDDEEEHRENEETKETKPKPPHFDGRNFRKKREEVDDYKLVTEEEKTRLREKVINHLWLAPLTKGGNLPFRRLCATFEAKVLVSEMSYARFLNRGNPVEKTHLRRHDSEEIFGAQIATNIIEEGVRSARMAYEFNADFVDLNCGCPTHEVTKRGLGARLLRKPAKLAKLVEGLANGSPLPLSVKIRLGVEDDKPALKLAEEIENAGASVLIVHGRTKEQRYTKKCKLEFDWRD